MPKLAINGGKPIRTELFPGYKVITEEEKRAAMEVLDTGNLSGFLAGVLEGGPKVIEFENLWAEKHEAKHCISVNSATSGLFTAVGSLGIGPGDEVIVSPYTMSASATCALVYGAVPVFADIQEDIFNLDPKSIEERITERTKAIVVVHIFGNPANMDPIMEIARKHNLYVIEDCAQSPLGKYKGKFVGTLGDIGVFSLNYHKHIHTGEGGMITTNDDDLAIKIKLIRNHGECYPDLDKIPNITNLWGFNYRLTEIQAAIGITQLKRLDRLLEDRIDNCKYIEKKMANIPGIVPPVTYDNCRHSYYLQSFRYDENIIGVSRNKFIEAVSEELPFARGLENVGKLLGAGYVTPIYMEEFYQRKTGTKSAYNDPRYKSEDVCYDKGICPVCERMHYKELFTNEYMRPPMTRQDLDDVVNAFEKVYENRNELK